MPKTPPVAVAGHLVQGGGASTDAFGGSALAAISGGILAQARAVATCVKRNFHGRVQVLVPFLRRMESNEGIFASTTQQWPH